MGQLKKIPSSKAKINDKMKETDKKLEKSLKAIVKTSILVSILLIISKIFVYLYKVIIARFFGPEIYGIFSLSSTVIGLFIVFASLGLSEGLLRFVALYRGKNKTSEIKHIVGFTLRTLIFSSIIAGILLFFLAEFISVNIFHNTDLIFFLKVFTIIIPLAVLSYALLAVVRAYEKIGWYLFISSVARNGLEVVFILIFIFIGVGKSSVVFSYVISFLGMFLLSYVIFKQNVLSLFNKVSIKKNKKRKITKDLLEYSLPLTLSTFIFMLFAWIDIFTIGFFKTTTEVGFYNAAVPIAMLLTVIPELFMKLFFPLINKEYSRKNFTLIKELSKQVGKWIFLINFPILILLLIFPGAALSTLFGPDYVVASTALRLLSIGFFASTGIGAISLRLISMTGRSKLILINTSIATVLNTILNMILVPMEKIWFIDNSSGLNGAAIATLISLFFIAGLFILQSFYYLSILPVRRTIWKIILATILPTLLLIFLIARINITLVTLIILSSFFILFYTMSILLLKALDRNDLIIIDSIKNKLKSKLFNTVK